MARSSSGPKKRDYQVTPELLRQYAGAALENAVELLQEAILLEQNKHHARAYFLAVASIEETGKALLAYGAQNRNLKDSAVAHTLKKSFEDHSQKITAAFTPWLLASEDVRKAAMPAVNLMVDLKFGREPSMYTDIHLDGSKVNSPSKLVRDGAAVDCIRVAQGCLEHAVKHVQKISPPAISAVQDRFFSLKPSVFQGIAKTADFWEFYISRMETGSSSLEEAVVAYNDKFYSRGAVFKDTAGV